VNWVPLLDTIFLGTREDKQFWLCTTLPIEVMCMLS
jgi:hypothetical protein